MSEFATSLDTNALVSYTDYRFDDLIAVTERLARQSIVAAGGTIEVDSAGNGTFLIPLQTPQPSPFAQSWDPGPNTGSHYADADIAQIHFDAPRTVARDVARFAPGWAAIDCVQGDLFGLYPASLGRSNVLLMQLPDDATPCRVVTQIQLADEAPSLHVTVGHYPQGDWVLGITVNSLPFAEALIGSETSHEGWSSLSFDLSAFAGQTVIVELLNRDDGGIWNNGYWADISLSPS